MLPPKFEFDRVLHEMKSRHRQKFCHMIGRVDVEALPSDPPYSWLVNYINEQLSDIGVNSTGGRVMPRLHFEMVEVKSDERKAHVFEAQEFTFIVVTQPMVDEMLKYARRLVKQNWAFMSLQIAPAANQEEIALLIWLMQMLFVTCHEYSHLVRGHMDQPQVQMQELDADGYSIYHNMPYFFHGGGNQFALKTLRTSGDGPLSNSILSCFILSIMLQFCARWVGNPTIESNMVREHPTPPVRIKSALLIVEMWCREVGSISTDWMTDGTLKNYYSMVASLLPPDKKTTWDQHMSWLRSSEGEKYVDQLMLDYERLRKS